MVSTCPVFSVVRLHDAILFSCSTRFRPHGSVLRRYVSHFSWSIRSFKALRRGLQLLRSWYVRFFDCSECVDSGNEWYFDHFSYFCWQVFFMFFSSLLFLSAFLAKILCSDYSSLTIGPVKRPVSQTLRVRMFFSLKGVSVHRFPLSWEQNLVHGSSHPSWGRNAFQLRSVVRVIRRLPLGWSWFRWSCQQVLLRWWFWYLVLVVCTYQLVFMRGVVCSFYSSWQTVVFFDFFL